MLPNPFQAMRRLLRQAPPEGQALDTIANFPERFPVLRHHVTPPEIDAAIQNLSPILQTSRKGLGEQARTIGALALCITEMKDTAPMQKVADLLTEAPEHVGANTLVRLTRINARGHFYSGGTFEPDDYDAPDENLSILERELLNQFFSSDNDDPLAGARVIRDEHSGKDDLLLASASSIVLRGNQNQQLHDAITRHLGVRHYYEAAMVAAHGRPMRLPQPDENRVRNIGAISENAGIERFLQRSATKDAGIRPEWLNANPRMREILDQVEASGVTIQYVDPFCFTSHFDSENLRICMTPSEYIDGGKEAYAAVILHEVGHATSHLRHRASIETYGHHYSTWHEEAVAQGISVHLARQVAQQDDQDHQIIRQKAIGEHLRLFAHLQLQAVKAHGAPAAQVHAAIQRDIARGISVLTPQTMKHATMNEMEVSALSVMDCAQEATDNLTMLNRVWEGAVSPCTALVDAYLRDAKDAIETFIALSGEKEKNAYAPEIVAALHPLCMAIPSGDYAETSPTGFFRGIQAEFAHRMSVSDGNNPEQERMALDRLTESARYATPLTEMSTDHQIRFVARAEHAYQAGVQFQAIDSLYSEMSRAAQKIEHASKTSVTHMGRFGLAKAARALYGMADGLLTANDLTMDAAGKALSGVESAINRLAPSIYTDVRPAFDRVRERIGGREAAVAQTTEDHPGQVAS